MLCEEGSRLHILFIISILVLHLEWSMVENATDNSLDNGASRLMNLLAVAIRAPLAESIPPLESVDNTGSL